MTTETTLTDEAKQAIADEAEASEALVHTGDRKYTPLVGFDTSLELQAYADDRLQRGDITHHKWQVEESRFLCAEGKYTRAQPLKYILAACNGSGKDAYVISTFAVWHCITKVRSRCIITSSSGEQLKTQTEAYIRTLCSQLNEVIGEKVFIIKQRHIVCKWTGSEIKMIATDEPGRAEGFHPFPDHPEGELCIIVNEGKSVELGIYEALSRCTYNRFIIVSSPGKTNGFMYDKYVSSVEYPNTYVNGRWFSRKIGYLDCPHIPLERIQAELDDLPGGEDNLWFRSARKAEFTSLDESVVISNENIRTCQTKFIGECKIGRGLRAGLDLAGGGDENCLVVYQDNKFKALEAFRMDLTNISVHKLIGMFEKHGFTKETAGNISADHGGIGQGFAGHFRDLGWNLTWVTNGTSPANKILYANKGTENWFTFSKLVQRNLVELPVSQAKLLHQLANRYVDAKGVKDKIQLQSKKEAKAEGRPSPDRADALVLCWAGVSYLDFDGFKPSVIAKPSHNGLTTGTNELVKYTEQRRYAGYEDLVKQHQEMTLEQKGCPKRPKLGANNVLSAYRRLISNN